MDDRCDKYLHRQYFFLYDKVLNGFLLQEMVREANTTGSKANDAAILADVVMIKEELERIREQVENIE